MGSYACGLTGGFLYVLLWYSSTCDPASLCRCVFSSHLVGNVLVRCCSFRISSASLLLSCLRNSVSYFACVTRPDIMRPPQPCPLFSLLRHRVFTFQPVSFSIRACSAGPRWPLPSPGRGHGPQYANSSVLLVLVRDCTLREVFLSALALYFSRRFCFSSSFLTGRVGRGWTGAGPVVSRPGGRFDAGGALTGCCGGCISQPGG